MLLKKLLLPRNQHRQQPKSDHKEDNDPQHRVPHAPGDGFNGSESESAGNNSQLFCHEVASPQPAASVRNDKVAN